MSIVEPDSADQPTTPEAPTGKQQGGRKLGDRFELTEAVLLAIATVLIAWSAFQATKWSGAQADSYARSGAARTESTRASTRAGQNTIVDVTTFADWVSALAAERTADPHSSQAADGSYLPDPSRLSGFLYERFRDEFKPAVQAWVALRPLQNPDAPPTPFAMKEYQLASVKEADELEARADDFARAARDANQTSDNYVMVTILFASVMFFAGISTKMVTHRARIFLIGGACTLLVAGAVLLIAMPKEF